MGGEAGVDRVQVFLSVECRSICVVGRPSHSSEGLV